MAAGARHTVTGFLLAHELVSLIRRKKLSATEVMEIHLRQIDKINPWSETSKGYESPGAAPSVAFP